MTDAAANVRAVFLLDALRLIAAGQAHTAETLREIAARAVEADQKVFGG